MHLAQFLILEITSECNLGREHAWCPSGQRVVGPRRLDDETILRTIVAAYREHGFRGLVGFYYYCEPMLEWPRMQALIDRAKAEVPEARFCLWTNGTRPPAEMGELARFAQIHVSDYTGLDRGPWLALRGPATLVRVFKPLADARLQAADHQIESRRPCCRPYVELIFAADGEGHLCCHDWRGDARFGNLLDEPIAAILPRWQALRRKIAARPMASNAPAACRGCPMREGGIPCFLPNIRAAATAEILAQRRLE